MENFTSEKIVIGYGLRDFPVLRKKLVQNKITDKSFASKTAQEVVKAIFDMHSKGLSIDIGTTSRYLKHNSKAIDKDSIDVWLKECLLLTSGRFCIDAHMEALIRDSEERALSSILYDSIDEITEGEEVDSIISKLKHNLTKVITEEEESENVIDEMQTRYYNFKDNLASGIRSRWGQINDLIGGYPKGKITVIGARPKKGKSTLALNEAVYSAMRQGIPTLFFSLEMDKAELYEKAGSDLTNINNMDLHLGKLSKEKIRKFLKEGPMLVEKSPLYVDDNPARTVEDICSAIRDSVDEKKIELVVVDYLQLIKSSPHKKFQSRTYEIQHITNELRIVAKQCDVAIILLSQLTRPPKYLGFDKAGGAVTKAPMPVMGDLKDSSAIEQDAYIIMFIGDLQIDQAIKPVSVPNSFRQITLRIEANRGGPTGDVHFWFARCFNKFVLNLGDIYEKEEEAKS